MQPWQITRQSKHDADPLELIDFRLVGIMLECSPGELFARAAFMHHDNQGHDALRHCAVLKGLTVALVRQGLGIELIQRNTIFADLEKLR